jgi:hypothetical protein
MRSRCVCGQCKAPATPCRRSQRGQSCLGKRPADRLPTMPCADRYLPRCASPCTAGRHRRHIESCGGNSTPRPVATPLRTASPGPKPFILPLKVPSDPNAVWDSGKGSASEKRHSAARRPCRQKRPHGLVENYWALPEFVRPQPCRSVTRPPSSTGWVHAIKFDGYRVQLRVKDGRVTVRTRNGWDWTAYNSARSPRKELRSPPVPDAIIDDEIAALDQIGADLCNCQADVRSRGRAFNVRDVARRMAMPTLAAVAAARRPGADRLCRATEPLRVRPRRINGASTAACCPWVGSGFQSSKARSVTP